MSDGRTTTPVALVTGASRGIGRAVAERMGADGWTVAALARTKPDLVETVDRVERRGGRSLAVVADVTSQERVEAAVAEVVDRFGRLDVVVNNAGDFAKGELGDQPVDDWMRTVEVILHGSYHVARAAVRQLRDQPSVDGVRGHLVSVNSGAGLAGYPTGSAYSAAKFGVRGLDEALRAEGAEWGVKVTEVYLCATVRTAMSAHRDVPKLEPADVAEVVQRIVTSPPAVAVSRVDIEQLVAAGG